MVLQRGLTFSPMQPLDKFTLTKDIYLFCRQLMFKILCQLPSLADQLPSDEQQPFRNLLDLLRENENNLGKRNFIIHSYSQSTPPFTLCPTVLVFFYTVCREIHMTFQKMKISLKQLWENRSFIIKEADKGGNIVIWPIDLYVKEVLRQLNNNVYYLALPFRPHKDLQEKIGPDSDHS